MIDIYSRVGAGRMLDATQLAPLFQDDGHWVDEEHLAHVQATIEGKLRDGIKKPPPTSRLVTNATH
jgi:hypothetical protein